MKICCTLLLFLALSLASYAQSPDPGELQDEVSFLCGERFQGRAYGTNGNKGAAVYICSEFERAGLELEARHDGGRGCNVMGRLRAVREGAKDIIISAYYDGIGRNTRGELCPGADANVSGVVALLELARAFAGRPLQSYNLVFVALDGHYAGLTGGCSFAAWYRGDAYMMISLDTMGSTLSPPSPLRRDYLMAIGAEPWRRSLEGINARTAMLDLSYDYYGSESFTRLFYNVRASHKYMLESGVPCVMFTSGITMNTNHPSDCPESLDYAVFARRILLIEKWISSFDKKRNNY